MVWAALASSSPLQLRLVHCRRFKVAFWHLQALFAKVHGQLVRVFPLAVSWDAEGECSATDACTWRFAGPCSNVSSLWYAIPLTERDLRKFRVSVGLSTGGFGHQVTRSGWCQGLFEAVLRSIDRLSRKSPTSTLSRGSLAMDAVLGSQTQWRSQRTCLKYPTGYQMILSRMWALNPHHSHDHSSAGRDCGHQLRIVGSGRPLVAKRRRGAQSRRLTSSEHR